ncbi:paraquat-inducible protein A [Maritimibacter sp. UBA3975]|uniref:paraquat-inducible protein A n=1 Tax=Maritimibacter sp. UBA3975 TaxID=1946833 RepID=UPI000C09855E|nr:paraquat-inducible protein A [Maritimibacter sp. UBA3975]MAM61166.1 paraquat-inducible membrane protein A [Maritimibacter sp.]|tara:strand:+ start:7827 stop:8264 length:438 start_codon:yes stop_codon:yes gene_type:complete
MMWLRWLNLSLILLFPIAWVAPLLRAGLNLPLLGLKEVSVVSGLWALMQEDLFLALIVFLFAIVAPAIKVAGMALIQFGRMGERAKPVFGFLGRLAMADIFLMALYVVIIKGVAMTRVEVGWGLYLFTFCVLASLLVTLLHKPRD